MAVENTEVQLFAKVNSFEINKSDLCASMQEEGRVRRSLVSAEVVDTPCIVSCGQHGCITHVSYDSVSPKVLIIDSIKRPDECGMGVLEAEYEVVEIKP